jgi:hypothetical protein
MVDTVCGIALFRSTDMGHTATHVQVTSSPLLPGSTPSSSRPQPQPPWAYTARRSASTTQPLGRHRMRLSALQVADLPQCTSWWWWARSTSQGECKGDHRHRCIIHQQHSHVRHLLQLQGHLHSFLQALHKQGMGHLVVVQVGFLVG